MGSSQSLDKDSDAVVHQKFNRSVSETQFEVSEMKKSFDIVAMTHAEKPTKLYFVLLGNSSHGFCLSIDIDESDKARQSFDCGLDYQDPKYTLSFVSNGTLGIFVGIINLTIGAGTTTVRDPNSYAKNLFRIERMQILEPNQDHIERIQQFFIERGVENAEIV